MPGLRQQNSLFAAGNYVAQNIFHGLNIYYAKTYE